MENKQVLALIPARSGSKGIIHKNIREIAGRPLISYSIHHALKTPNIQRTIVSTDSEKYARIARAYGSETPFIRPLDIAGDFSTDFEVFDHALNWLMENDGYCPEIIVHLRPTFPVRNESDIQNAIQLLIDNPELDAVRSVVPAPKTPFKMWIKNKEGLLDPASTCEVREAHSLPRQILPESYMQNACIDIIRSRTILEKKSMVGSKVAGYFMSRNFDIDYIEDFEKVEKFLLNNKDLKVVSL